MGLEKTSRKKLTAVAFEGRQMTQTKAQQNYILRDGLGSREINVLLRGTGTGTMDGLVPGVLLALLKLNLLHV